MGKLLLITILLLGAFLRFNQITQIPYGFDSQEALNGNTAIQTIATGNLKMFYTDNEERGGLFVNLAIVPIWFFGNKIWALRALSAILGMLTIWGVYLLSRELFINHDSRVQIALLSSFFTATSFWHLTFSRLGLEAILIPLLSSFGFYFLLAGLRKGLILNAVLAGIALGLLFYTRTVPAIFFMPVVAVPIIWYLKLWYQKDELKSCPPCFVSLFILTGLVVCVPLLLPLLQNPPGLLTMPILPNFSDGGESALKILSAFFIKGDCDWKYNLACKPQLHPLVAVFFLAGIFWALRNYSKRAALYMLGAWIFFMLLPVILTRNNASYAPTLMGLLPPVFILSALGASWVGKIAQNWLARQKIKRPSYENQLKRIQRELKILFVIVLLLIPLTTYRDYFFRWAQNPNAYFALSADLVNLGKFLNELPQETQKYIVLNQSDTLPKNIPLNAQIIMFITNTSLLENRDRKNMQYLWPEQIENLRPSEGQKFVIASLNSNDLKPITSLKQKIPGSEVKAPGDFIILQNK